MNELLKVLLSLSLAGSVLILLLLLGKKLYQNRLSRQWQYFIWLVVIARLLLPFGQQNSPVDRLFRQQQAIQVEIQTEKTDSFDVPASEAPVGESVNRPVTAASLASLVKHNLWLLWLTVALALLASKIANYRSFVRYLRAGRQQVSDIALLDTLALVGQQLGVDRPVELYTHSLISSPLLVGLVRPSVYLPQEQISIQDFQAIARHELTHYRHRDGLIKWLAQLALCVHWFNPLVWRMCREINRDCEFACDQAATQDLDQQGRQAYGDALMRTLAAGRQVPTPPTATALHESAQLLQQRLGALMQGKKPSKGAAFLSLCLAILLMTGTAAAGVYTGPAQTREVPSLSIQQWIGQLLGRIAAEHSKQQPAPFEEKEEIQDRTPAYWVERCYQKQNFPIFSSMFPQLDSSQQQAWLERIYQDGQLAFFSIALDGLKDGVQIDQLAGRAYQDGQIAFFSLLADRMGQKQLENWLDQALDDRNVMFASVAKNKLDDLEDWDWDWEKEWEKEADQKQAQEYEKWGITRQGKHYYYNGQLTRVFLDQRQTKSFYTLELNPVGTVSVKVIRDNQEQILRVELMSEEEVDQLFRELEE